MMGCGRRCPFACFGRTSAEVGESRDGEGEEEDSAPVPVARGMVDIDSPRGEAM